MPLANCQIDSLPSQQLVYLNTLKVSSNQVVKSSKLKLLTSKTILLLLHILYILLSSLGTILCIGFTIYNQVVSSNSLIVQCCLLIVLVSLLVIGLLGLLFLRYQCFYSNKILFSISSIIIVFLLATCDTLLLEPLLLNDTTSILSSFTINSWTCLFQIIACFLVAALLFIPSGALVLIYNAKSSTTQQENVQSSVLKQIHIATIVVECLALIAIINSITLMLFTSSSSSMFFYYFMMTLLLIATPLISLLCTVLQLKRKSTIATAITLGANIYPLLIMSPVPVYIIIQFCTEIQVDTMIWNLFYQVAVDSIVAIIIPNSIVVGLSIAALLIGKE